MVLNLNLDTNLKPVVVNNLLIWGIRGFYCYRDVRNTNITFHLFYYINKYGRREVSVGLNVKY